MGKVYFAGVVLGATVVAAVWLYTYRVWATFEYVDPQGHHFPPTRVRLQPWWSVYATLALTLIGSAVSQWLLPERRRLIGRFGAGLAAAFSAKPSYY